MTDELQIPVQVEHIDCTPIGRGQVAVRISGKWLTRRRVQEARAFLVVQTDDRRHRFPALPEPRRPRLGKFSGWGANFALPSWLEPRLQDGMSLWLGNIEIPLPDSTVVSHPDADGPVSNGAGADTDMDMLERDGDAGVNEERATESVQLEETSDAQERSTGDHEFAEVREPEAEANAVVGDDSGRDATVTALRAELQQRAAAEAQLRGALIAARAELEGRAADRLEVEETQAELRRELDELIALVEQESTSRVDVESRAMVLASEVAELRGAAEQEASERILLEARTGELSEELSALRAQLAQSEVAREAALGEAAGLRAELERLGTDLAEARRSTSASDGLSEAQALLMEARAVTARLREASGRTD